ncbi:MAG: tetratricopeptide repeat protein [Owenweeksia sp.]|nr:tetratricopeptide repeat protein [Owenweeksia sp.]
MDMHEDDGSINITPLINRFEQMLKQKDEWYFDVQEFEVISDFYFETARPAKAMKAAELASRQHPYCISFVARKAQVFTFTNELKKAQKQIQRLAEMDPEGLEHRLAQAAYHSKKEEHQEAIDCYQKALRIASFPEEIWPVLAMEYQIMGRYKMACKYLRRTLSENPRDELASYNIALCFDFLDQSEEGIRYFTQFTDQHPYSEIAWYHMGILYAKERDYENALKAIDYAILIDEFFTAAYYEKARVLERTYRYKEASEIYKASIENEGPTGYSYYKIGICHLKQHKPDKALIYFTKAIQEDSDMDEAYYELALLKDENQAGPESVYFINKALELCPENANYLYIAAEIHRRAGMLNEAELLYTKLIELGHIDPDIFIDYAELLFDLCEFDEGMEVLYQGVQLNPDSAEINYRLSGYLYTLQEEDEASIYFKKALKLDPDRRLFFFQLFPKLKHAPAVSELSRKYVSR